MASLSASSLTFKPSSFRSYRISQMLEKTSIFQSVSFRCAKHRLTSSKNLRLQVSCAAKEETVLKVCDIVRDQLGLKAEVELNSETKFSSIGADSLDTVEIVMALEEEYKITIEEDKAQNITTVQDAADLIEELVQRKDTPA